MVIQRAFPVPSLEVAEDRPASHAELLRQTELLNFSAPVITELIARRGWDKRPVYEKIEGVYNYVRDEIAFGYNIDDAIAATEVLADGYGQCNTKATLLMALLRAVGVPCRLHGFTIDKSLQRGVVPELVYRITPRSILHSWVEIHYEGKWLNLEGFILDRPYLTSLQKAFPNRSSLCGYGAGTECFQSPAVVWDGGDTYIQRTGINADLGIFATPDEFYQTHRQSLSSLKVWLYQKVIRHWMNRRVADIRNGRLVPTISRK